MKYVTSPFGRVPLLGMGEYYPQDFKFPDVNNYIQQTAQGIKEVTSFTPDDLGVVMTPVGKSNAAGIRTLMEAAGGGDIASLIVGAIPGAPPLLSSMLKDLLDNALDVVISVVGQSVGDALGGALSSIPFAGVFLKLLVDAIGQLASISQEDDRIAAALAQAKDVAHKNHYNYCSWWISHPRDTCPPYRIPDANGDPLPPTCPGSLGMTELCTAIPTGDNGEATPADMFRPIAYNLSPDGMKVLSDGPGIPWCPTACYVWLCGGEAPIGLGRAKYDALLAKARAQTGDPKLGLPKEVQRSMWALIRGICASTNDPDPTNTKAHRTDQGRGLYPILIDMILRSWKPYVVTNNLPTEGYWDETLLRVIAEDQATTYKATGTYCDTDGNCTENYYSNSCAEYSDIVGVYDKKIGALGDHGFLSHAAHWGINLQAHYTTTAGKLVGYPVSESAQNFVASGKSRSLVTVRSLSPQVAKLLASSPTKLTATEKAILAAGGLGGSYLAYRGITTLARHLRSR